MSRRAALNRAAHWALDEAVPLAERPAPPAADDVRATLDDPALAEALAQSASFGRLSDGDVRAMRDARRRTLTAGGTAAIALLLVSVGATNGWLAGVPARPAHYETQRGQQLDVALTDGTRLHLNGATSLDVTIGKSERRVELTQGEAYFDVAHEPARPFVVRAGGSDTRVLGTAFDVDLGRGDVKLAVYRGKVRFSGSGGAVIVAAGSRSRFAGGVASAPSPFDASQQDWRQGWLDTDGTRLGDLVDALNRRGGPVIEAPQGALADIALAGRFRIDNAQQLLDAIGPAYGFAVVRNGDRMRLVERGAGDANPSSQ
jgi:transmembrane sensor